MKYEIKEILKKGSQKYGDFIFEKIDGKYCARTYSEFYEDILKLAAKLQKTHAKDDKILVYAENSYNYMVLDAAVMGYTCICATISKEWSAYDLEGALKILQPKTVVFSKSKSDNIEKVKSKYSDINFEPIEDIIPKEAGDVDFNRIKTGDTCKIIFSSGTTGMPKGVMLTQENIFASFDSLARRTTMTEKDVDYLFLPLNHTYANIWNFWNSANCGMKLYLCSDTSEIFEEIQEVKPTVFCAVPLILQKLYAFCTEQKVDPKLALGGNIRYMFCGGAAFPPEIRKFFKENGVTLLEAYGLTETSSIISLEYPNDNDFTSVGTILENLEVKIDNPDERGVGEIIVRGTAVLKSYYNKVLNPFDEEGFFHTGDLGRLDGTTLYFEGRKKRVIVYANGENIYPEEIEKLFTDENINKVKVYDHDNKLTAKLYVKTDKDYAAYIEKINSELPKYSKIRDFEVVVDEIGVRMK